MVVLGAVGLSPCPLEMGTGGPQPSISSQWASFIEKPRQDPPHIPGLHSWLWEWDVGKPSPSSSSQAAGKPLPSGCCCLSLPGNQAGQKRILGRWFLLISIRLIEVGKHAHSCLGDRAPAGCLIWADSPPPRAHLRSVRHPFTCRHEEDAGTKDDVVSGFVELAGCNAESTHEKQNHTQDRENTRGSNSPCRGERERGRKNSAGVRERKKGHGNSTQARGRGTLAHFVSEGEGERQREMCRSGGVIQGDTKASGDGRRERETKYVRKREQSKATCPCPGCRCCCEPGGCAWEVEGGCGAGG